MIKNLVAALGLSAIAGVAAAGPEMEELLKPCVSCHGMDGVGATAKTPHLNWQLPAYLIESMEILQSGGRHTAVPKHIPKTMTREQIVAIAKFYGGNRTPRLPQTVDSAKVAKGLELYRERCGDCHLDNGRSTDDKGAASPILAGQALDYLLAQERMYMSGKRRFATQADKAHKGMTDADVEAVSHFFAGQDTAPPQAGDEAKKKKRRS